MNGKLVKTSMGCVSVSKETETSLLYILTHGVPIYLYIYN